MATRKATKSTATSPAELRELMWKAADKLRGSMNASDYMNFVLGLIFLKYVSDSFDERVEALRAELVADGFEGDALEDELEDCLNDPDEFYSASVYFVPEKARWGFIAQQAKSGKVGALLDTAMREIMVSNPRLSGALSEIYNRENVDQTRLAGLIDLFSNADFKAMREDTGRSSLDILGEVYEYFLGQFASKQGQRGGEFYTPRSVVRTLVEILNPVDGTLYDPCCGSGGMFVQSEKFVESHGKHFKQEKGYEPALTVYGQEYNDQTWRLARLNLAIHGIFGHLGDRWGDTFAEDRHAGENFDFVLANPPFNLKEWSRRTDDPRWTFGVPPERNANYAWLQHIWSKLNAGGAAAVVLANGSMTSNTGGEDEIRRAMVQGDAVAAMLVLPANLFTGTAIPVCVWVLAKDKSAGKRGALERKGQVLMIDARGLGRMVDRRTRVFDDADIQKIAGAWHRWRGTDSELNTGEYEDELGFCRSVMVEDIEAQDWALAPGRYVGSAVVEDEGEPVEVRIARLRVTLAEQFAESARLAEVVQKHLAELDLPDVPAEATEEADAKEDK